MTLEKMQCFVDIVKLNSFTKAAQKNFITQAAISQQIATMETELGFSLFERNRGGFTVTDSGQSFYNSCLRILTQYASALSRARCIAHNVAGFISMGVWPGINPTHIRRPVELLLERYPNSQIVIRTGSPAEFCQRYKEGRQAITVAMPYDFYDNSIADAVITPLFTCEYRLGVSARHPLAAREQVTAADMENLRFAVLSEDFLGRQTASHVVMEQMRHRHHLMNTLVVPNFDTQQLMVATGQAVMLLPECCVPESTEIRCLPITGFSETCTFAAIWHSSHASPVLTALADILGEYFRALYPGTVPPAEEEE